MGILDFNRESIMVRLMLTIFTGLIGGFIFVYIHIPLPWVLGPMTALLIASKLWKGRFYWSARVRNWGLVIIGYASGLSFNRAAFNQIVGQLPWMLLMTVILLAFTAFTAFVFSKLTGIDYPSILTGGIPGALTQMVILGEEMEGMDITVITFLQVVRLMLIVVCIPLLIYSPLYSVEKTGVAAAVQASALPLSVLVPKALLFAVLAFLFALLAKRFKFPTPYLLGPILGIALLNILGFQGPALSPSLLVIAQFSMGCYLGLLLKPEKLQNKAKIISLSVVNGVILIVFSMGLSYILSKTHDIGSATSFLSMAPGGADQMGVIASVIAADVSMVTSYQLFRMLFINLAIPPLLKAFINYYKKMRLPAADTASSGE